MKSQTSIVAEQTRLKTWAEQIKSCQSRPKGISVDNWCLQNGMTKANYYYRLKRVRQACLDHAKRQSLQLAEQPAFVELPTPKPIIQTRPISNQSTKCGEPVAVLRGPNNLSLEIYSTAGQDVLKSLIVNFLSN